MTEPIRAWAIKSPSGDFWSWNWHEIKQTVISDFEEEQGEDWMELQNQGFQCVQVEIREITEGE